MKSTQMFLEQTKDLSLSGFSIVCSWHFLAVFTALPSLSFGANQGRPLLYQAMLCLAIAGGYLVGVLGSKRLEKIFKGPSKSKRNALVIGSSIFGCIASAFCVVAYYYLPELSLASYIILGFAEAPVMLPWLRLAQVDTKRHKSRHALALNMGAGGVIAFIVASLQEPYSFCAFCALPLVSQASFISYARYIEGAARIPKNDEAKSEFHLIESLENNLHFIIFGFVFGAVQVALSTATTNTGSINFALNDAWPLLGTVASAALIVAIPHGMLKTQGIFVAQRLSIILFTAGCLLQLQLIVSTLSNDVASVISQVLVISGFNAFDFGFMVYSLAWAIRLNSGYTKFIGANRFLLYLSIVLGILASNAAQTALSSFPNIEMAICSCAIVLLLLTILPVFDELAPYGAPIETGERMPAPGEERRKEAPAEKHPTPDSHTFDQNYLDYQADQHKLSKREREILGYLAKGHNASFIQEKLWISICTVKTHISNIYRKFDVHSQQQLLSVLQEGETDAALPDHEKQRKPKKREEA